jgi:hypothetical protein
MDFRSGDDNYGNVGTVISTSTRISLCRSTPFRIFAMVMQAIMTMAPDMKPWAHAERTSPFGSVGLFGRIARILKPFDDGRIIGLMVLKLTAGG